MILTEDFCFIACYTITDCLLFLSFFLYENWENLDVFEIYIRSHPGLSYGMVYLFCQESAELWSLHRARGAACFATAEPFQLDLRTLEVHPNPGDPMILDLGKHDLGLAHRPLGLMPLTFPFSC